MSTSKRSSKRASSQLSSKRPSHRLSATQRPSPTESATLYRLGTKKKGNDGNTWQVVSTVRGSQRWVRITPRTEPGKEFLDRIEILKLAPKIEPSHVDIILVVLQLFYELRKKFANIKIEAVNCVPHDTHGMFIDFGKHLKNHKIDFIRIMFAFQKNSNGKLIVKNKKFFICFQFKTDAKLETFIKIVKKNLSITLTNRDISSHYTSFMF